MERILVLLILTLSIMSNVFGEEKPLKVGINRYQCIKDDGWVFESGNIYVQIWKKQVKLNDFSAEKNRGRKVKTDRLGQKQIAVVYDCNSKEYKLYSITNWVFLDDMAPTRLSIFKASSELSTILFKSRFYEKHPEGVYDNLGRIVKYHQRSSALLDWYEADGYSVEVKYDDNSFAPKSLHIWGYGEYPRTYEERAKIPEWKDCPMLNKYFTYEYEGDNRHSNLNCSEKRDFFAEDINVKHKKRDETNLLVENRYEVIEYDANHNPFIVKIKSTGKILKLYYYYD